MSDASEGDRAAGASGFLGRWSRRKRGAVAVSPAPEAAPAAVPLPEFDPASLPPIESLTAESDIAAFLRPQVPAALRTAALRRAWTLDPAIRDYVGPADYAWDFNAEQGMAGFSLELGSDVKRLLAQAIGLVEEAEKPAPAEPGGPDMAEPGGPDMAEPGDSGMAEPGGPGTAKPPGPVLATEPAVAETLAGPVAPAVTAQAGPRATAPTGPGVTAAGPTPSLPIADPPAAPPRALATAALPPASDPAPPAARRHGSARPR